MQTQRGTANIFDFSSTDSDSQHALLSVAAIMPEQFYGPSFTSQTACPEVSLMRAVLEEALTCFQYQFYLRRHERQKLAQEAESWFFSDDADWPFAFLNICYALHLEPTYIRRGLRNLQANCPLKVPQRKRRTVGVRRPLQIAA
jgi:hypothetical protein